MGTVQMLVEYYLLTRLLTESLEYHIRDLKKNLTNYIVDLLTWRMIKRW